MDLLVGIIIGVIVLTLLVVAHELGHALVARKYGTVVEEFGIGFPPKVWSKKVKNSPLGKDVEFSFNLLPLGGFVKLQGEHDDDSAKGDYGAMTFWQKTQVLLAGVAVNWVLAAVLFSVLALVGLPKVLPNQFSIPSDTQLTHDPVSLVSVEEGLPAAKAGLKAGDTIVRFDNKPIETAEDLAVLSSEAKGKAVKVVYMRESVERTANVVLRADNTDKRGYLGAGPAQREFIKATWSAPIVGVGTTVQITWATLEGLGQLLGNTVSILIFLLLFATD